MTAEQQVSRTAKIIGVRESLVLIEVDENTPIMKNEMGCIRVGAERLKAEVLRVRQRTARPSIRTGVRSVDSSQRSTSVRKTPSSGAASCAAAVMTPATMISLGDLCVLSLSDHDPAPA